MRTMYIKALIFDLDGTLTNSEEQNRRALYETVPLFTRGAVLNEERMAMAWRQSLTLPGREIIPRILETLGLSHVRRDEFAEQYRRVSLRLNLENPALLPGAERLCRHLAEHGVKIALATNTTREKLRIKTAPFQDLFRLFRHVVTADDVMLGKPEPDCLRLAARLMEVDDPSKVLVIDDAPKGVEAARRARMPVLALLTTLPRADLPHGAVDYITDLSHFKPEEWGFPAFPSP